MIDRLLLIRQSLLPLLAEQGMGDVLVVTSYQKESNGRTNGPTLYFFELPTGGTYGWQGRKNTFDPATEIMTREETQVIRESFQIMGLNDSGEGVSPKDLTNMALMLIGSQSFRELISPEGAGVERITAIRSPTFVNDRDQFEKSPSFDFTLAFTGRILQQSRALERVEINTLSV